MKTTFTISLKQIAMLLLLTFGIWGILQRSDSSSLAETVADSVLPTALAGFNNNTTNLYQNYLTWPSSTTLKADDTTLQPLAYVQSTTPFNLTDINGDGLVDILLNQPNGYIGRNYGIFLNNGSLGFTWAYKCAVKENVTPTVYYGDCADAS